jgi:hypothetical protein
MDVSISQEMGNASYQSGISDEHVCVLVSRSEPNHMIFKMK